VSAPRLVLSAGDVSGDQHAARLVEALRARVPGLVCEGLGGPRMAAAGCALQENLVERAVFGVGAALAEIPHMLSVLRAFDARLRARRPAAVVVVDYPGLNLHVARVARRAGVPVVAFVAPQLWAWMPWRARRLARAASEALVIFPFEKPFFERAGLPSTYVGHPLADAIPERVPVPAAIAGAPCPVALLPGSRGKELRLHRPAFLEVARRVLQQLPEATFHTAHVTARGREALAGGPVEVQVHGGDVHGVMAGCRAALVASGTATLETALLGTPMVIAYGLTPVDLLIGRLLVIPELFGKANLVAGRRVFPEHVLVDGDVAPLVRSLVPLLRETGERRAQLEALDALRAEHLRAGATARSARIIASRYLA